MDGVGIDLERSRPLPLLGFLGPVKASVALRANGAERARAPPLVLCRPRRLHSFPGSSDRPEPRAVLFGGEGNTEETNPGNLLLMLAGFTGQLGKDSGFENQVASADFWLRATSGGRGCGAVWGMGIR